MLKVAFAALIGANIIALYFGASPFFVTFAQLPVSGVCTPDALGAANHAGIESMRNFLFPALMWLLGISIVNLVFAGTIVLHRSRAAT